MLPAAEGLLIQRTVSVDQPPPVLIALLVDSVPPRAKAPSSHHTVSVDRVHALTPVRERTMRQSATKSFPLRQSTAKSYRIRCVKAQRNLFDFVEVPQGNQLIDLCKSVLGTSEIIHSLLVAQTSFQCIGHSWLKTASTNNFSGNRLFLVQVCLHKPLYIATVIPIMILLARINYQRIGYSFHKSACTNHFSVHRIFWVLVCLHKQVCSASAVLVMSVLEQTTFRRIEYSGYKSACTNHFSAHRILWV